MRRPKILLAVTADQSLKLLYGFPRYLDGKGWDVHLVSGGDSRRVFSDYVGDCTGITNHVIPMRRDPSVAHDLRSLRAWSRLIGQVQPDIVLVGTPKASLLAHTAARWHRVPVRIYLLRGLRMEGSKGFRRAVLAFFERFTAHNATEILAVSRSLADLAGDLRIGRGKTGVIGTGSSNGIDIPEDRAVQPDQRAAKLRSVGLDPTIPVIGYVGRLTMDKGVHVLVQACARMARSGVAAQLLLVGDEDERGYLETLQGALSAGGVAHAFTGYARDPSRWVRLMDVFCLPSFREGMPNVALEASAWGKPVVTTTATGCRDAIIPGETGLAVAPGDVVELSTALTILVQDAELQLRLGAGGARWVAQNFDRAVVWDRYERHLRRTLTNRRRSSGRSSLRNEAKEQNL